MALASLPDDARIAVAYSGGLDSTALLDATVRVAGASRCVALHIHHGLSPNADAWAAHCAAQAHALDVAFEVRRVEVAAKGRGLEAAARDARYRALDAMCASHGVAVLWLAQHADDQAETLLLQLLRGAGLAGLAAMAAYHQPADADMVRMRPLLPLSRIELDHYAVWRALCWIDDESNRDTRYARNALRSNVLPVFATHFPGFRDALARTAQHAAAAQRLLDDLAELDLRAASRSGGRALARAVLSELSAERAANLLRFWMRSLDLPSMSAARIADMLRQLRGASDGHALCIEHSGQTLRLYRGEIDWQEACMRGAGKASARSASRLIDSVLRWQEQDAWPVSSWRGAFIFRIADEHDLATVSAVELARLPLTVRSRSGGERLRTSPNGSNRTLKNVFQERGVPSWQRNVPLLYAGDELLFVPLLGLNYAAAAVVQRAGPRRHIEWRPDLLLA